MNVNPSDVKVVGPVGCGKDIVSVPTTIPLGPRTTVGPPFGSVIVSDDDGILNKLPPRRMPSAEELGLVELSSVALGAVESDEELGVAVGLELDTEFPGSKVKVNPCAVRVDSAVTDGSEMVSDPTTIPDGPRMTVCPSGSVKVSDVLGRLNVEPPITIPSGAEVCETVDQM